MTIEMQGGQASAKNGLGIDATGQSSRGCSAGLGNPFNPPVEIRQGAGMTRVVRRKGEGQEENSEGDE